MLRFTGYLLLSIGGALAGIGGQALAGEDFGTITLTIPGRSVSVSLPDGMITSKGIEDPCVEAVSKSGKNQLVVTRELGDDQATVLVNGDPVDMRGGGERLARISAIRLSRDGSLVHVRTWKSGSKTVELVQDGHVVLSRPAGSMVRVIAFDRTALTLIVRRPNEPARLLRFQRSESGRISQDPEVLYEFGGCMPGSMRKIDGGYLLQLPCRAKEADLFRLDLEAQSLTPALRTAGTARFEPVVKTDDLRDKIIVVSVEGSDAGLHFYKGVMGLLLGQTGEPKSCASDAEGLQSWNQSYRLSALAELYKKTKAPVFAALGEKSIRNTLAARDALNDRATPANPSCGWSSVIYSDHPEERLSLLINQAMIGNALTRSCTSFGDWCPDALRREIAALRQCLASGYAKNFDQTEGLYRISPESGFRFAGEFAPWNWQVSFAALLAAAGGPDAVRAEAIAGKFLSEWEAHEDGPLWRYWPLAYYREAGRTDAQIANQRYEDIAHAGISLMSLADFEDLRDQALARGVTKRLDWILDQGSEPPRDLDGSGPEAARWVPAGGWADFASPTFMRTYARDISGSRSASAIYTNARLFDPKAHFDLILRIWACDDTCQEISAQAFDSAGHFMKSNPFFVIRSTNGI
ncbi:hypothetical protein JM93_02963 [Roseibium hamelinense]|uniref:Uncharacterized protein n=1 Tax=Roseibium hamelinense TaxID=150831 RepID=A0A562STP9_9HYPH|nr:hypothetical protein [Roseibium hamelinense]MTI43066.1 hypothetical protein [Roseibium hamelinense]TWI84631.1 hypothetical protein JM93_02963 [Roseibium hamelinense]